ncbi:MAG: 2-C-methyl-D-erythritol 4-phosphate cytidylyltransferase [Oscillospiraceae bacterium]|jgi:2-C-methyl-D-erythritol 4-phosphate cytidylyltransferase|nr:2-C-methyl-D-erythritol 4-phosphate cytidylyltransferase [Oscillospiraceae bacterium]
MPLFKKKLRCSAVIVAAGASTRMEGHDKMFLELGGAPVLVRTLSVFQLCAEIDEIIVVARGEDIPRVSALAQEYSITKLTRIVEGGETRTESVYSGVYAVSPKARYIAIHDGARPLVAKTMITATIRLAESKNAAAPAVEVKATIKTAERGYVTGTPDRAKLREVQTPQVFDAALIKAALENAKNRKLTLTDDCSAVEALGATVWLSEGSYENVKLTTIEDVLLAEGILRRRGEMS